MIHDRGKQRKDALSLSPPLIVRNPSRHRMLFEPLDRDQEPRRVVRANPTGELLEEPSSSGGLSDRLLNAFKITIFNPQRWNGHVNIARSSFPTGSMAFPR